jgi:anionic cell wall polymer biosynthesis LytR-Cps2A-Psr (LCP) family protein
VRSRHLYYYKDHRWNPDEGSDWSRIRRQQAFFHALLDRVHGVFPNIFKLNSFLDATVSDLTLDSGFSSGQMMSLGLHFHSLGAGNLTTVVLPTSPETIDGQDALIAVQPYAKREIDHFLAFGTEAAASHTTSTSSQPSSRSSTTTTAPTSTTPPGVVTDTPRSLPEPWNPSPC